MTIRKKILVVDDDLSMREMLAHILVKAGYEVILTEDGKTGVEKAWSERPHIVITDGLLPKLHGFLVSKKVKEFPRPPRVIILSGVYTKPTYSIEVKREYNADAFITKPFDVTSLLSTISKQVAMLPGDEAAA